MRFTTLTASLALAAPAMALGTSSVVENGCTEFDRYHTLTPNDTLTLLTSAHNPEQARGFVVVYAVDAAGEAISFNHLIGSQMAVDGIEQTEHSVNPLDFRAIGDDGAATDVDGDGVRDLDGAEYELAPDELLVPRFIGQGHQVEEVNGGGSYRGRLVLIDLNSGGKFQTTVDFLTYNDNEEVFSGEYTFNCWDNPRLLEISGAFSENFLKNSTSHDENESIGGREAGWFRFQGALANSSAATIADPAIYGVYVERVGSYSAADLPFEVGTREGHLLPRTIFGDNSESGGFTGDLDPSSIERRQPGSLLLYPEFNNLQGNLTLLTVTNSSATEEVRVHFVYYGKYDMPD
jgi:hypothetical protein